MPQIDGKQIRDGSIEGVDIKDGSLTAADFGTDITWKPPVDTVELLPSSNNNTGDARVAKSTNLVYVWDGNNWVTGTTSSNVAWDNITNKPTEFTPSSHNHDSIYFTESEIQTNYYTKLELQTSNSSYIHWDNLTNKPSTFPPSSHDHIGLYEPLMSEGSSYQYLRGDKTWQTLDTSNVAEFGNLYFTDSRVLSTQLTTFGSNYGTITNTDTVKSAIEKLAYDKHQEIFISGDSGLTLVSQQIKLGTPSEISATSQNGVTSATHTHAVSGLTSSNLSSSAGITNQQLANSSLTIGSTNISLGSTVTTISGLSINAVDITLSGNLTVNGTTTSIDTTNLLIEDNVVILNKNQTGTPATNLVSGLEVERGDATNYQFMFRELDDTFVIGEIGSLQAVATRQDSPTANGIAFWNNTSKRFDTIAGLTYSGSIINGTVNNTNQVRGVNFHADAIAPSGTTRLNMDGYFYATRVYNAVYNDLAEFMFKAEDAEPGDVMIQTKNGLMRSSKRGDRAVIGVYSDTYGYALGAEDAGSKLPIGISGRVLVKVREELKIGDLLISDVDGFATKATKEEELIPGIIIGKVFEEKNDSSISKIWILILNR